MGRVASYGSNFEGGCGLGDLAEKVVEKPTLIPELDTKTLACLASGPNRTCVLTDEGEVYTWGRNFEGSLGLGGDFGDVVYTPEKIESLSEVSIRQIACGSSHSAGVTDEGQVYQWGWTTSGNVEPAPLKSDTLFRDVQCGKEFSVAIDADMNVYTWGVDVGGCLAGNSDGDTPTLVEGLESVLSVSCGNSHALALCKGKKQGSVKVYAWGSGGSGQLGQGDTADSSEPLEVKFPGMEKGDKVSGVVCGDNYCMVWTEKGDAFSWGMSDDYRLGYKSKLDQTSPRHVLSLSKVKNISCGGEIGLALHTDNTKLSVWGGAYCTKISQKMKKCSFAACGQDFMVVYVGAYLVPLAPFYPAQPADEVEAIISSEITDDQDSLKDETKLLKKQYNRSLWAKEYCNLELLVSQNELDLAEHDPLMGAKVRYELFVMGLRFDYAKENLQDRSKWMEKGKLKLLEFKGDFKDQMKSSGLVM